MRDLASVCVPTLDEEHQVVELLDHLAALPGRWEVVLADGGSSDATVALAEGHPSRPRVLRVPGGRAAQLNAAAAAAHGDPLVFLHADSRLPSGAYASLMLSRAAGGNFRLRFVPEDRFGRLLGAVYAYQRRLGFFYGDSTIWCRRATFEALGGYRELPIMDDYDLVRRLVARFDTACLPGPATTSSRRWQRAGVLRTVASWWVIRWCYVAGMAPERLHGLYRRVR